MQKKFIKQKKIKCCVLINEANQQHQIKQGQIFEFSREEAKYL